MKTFTKINPLSGRTSSECMDNNIKTNVGRLRVMGYKLSGRG
jgi:hypothetical protein